jgi:hypothetical protein
MSICSFESCHNKKKNKELEYCYLKSHNKLNVNIIKEFEKSTLPKTKFEIVSVPRDGACLFISLAKYFNSEDEELCARKIQRDIMNWIIKNSNLVFPNTGGILIKEFIKLAHGEEDITNLDQYKYYYSEYAGDEVINKYGEIFPERWGSILELFAFHKIFNVNINIFLLKKIDRKFNVVLCSKKSKNYRFFLSQNFYDDKFDKECNLYFNTIYKNAHWEFLNKK